MRNPGLELTSTLQPIVDRAAEQPWHAVDEALARIQAIDTQTQAWTYVERAQTLKETPTYRGANAPLAGVPFAVKDVIDVAGMPTRCGSTAEPDTPRPFDAGCVNLLRRAGAVPVGKVVTAEYAFRRPGPTQNPRAFGHTPGGSSSGSAAAVADGSIPFALGTQTGGSIIRPAAFCGVVGFKPSFGFVPRDGLHFTCESLDVIGWLTRSVIDADLLADVLLPFAAPAVTTHTARPRKVAVVSGYAEQGLELAGLRALQRAQRTFEQHGIACVEVPFERGSEIANIHTVIMHYELARCLDPVVRRYTDRLSPSLLEAVQKGFAVSADEYLAQRHAQLKWRANWAELFGDADLVLTPSTPGVALSGTAHTGSSSFNRIWSAIGLPCLHLPMKADESGLPIGVQLVGRYEADRTLLSWATVLHADLLAQA
jgi:Asp-tRNA(Asn)/Glu-tRNA(Gln) amidotransferase A subunit family amidase